MQASLVQMVLEPPVALERFRGYLVVARVRGARVWVGCQATVLHSPVANTRLQLAWHTPGLELLGELLVMDSFLEITSSVPENALIDDEDEETVEEIFVNRTSTQCGQFPCITIRMP